MLAQQFCEDLKVADLSSTVVHVHEIDATILHKDKNVVWMLFKDNSCAILAFNTVYPFNSLIEAAKWIHNQESPVFTRIRIMLKNFLHSLFGEDRYATQNKRNCV